MISERQNAILKALIREYIKTAEPISSDFLAKKYDFGLCPSAIRIEMQLLIKSGFLEQPHTSAGRIPTDKAYRFFVDSLIEEKEGKENIIENELEEIFKEKVIDRFQLAGNLAKFLANTSSGLAIVQFFNNGISWKEGWEEIAKEPEFIDKDFIFNFLNFIDNFEEKIKALDTLGMHIYIGKEIPLPRAKSLSLICSTCMISPNESAFVTIIGPKRMVYTRNIKLLNSLNKALGDLI